MKLRDILKAKGSKVWTIKDYQTVYDALNILVKHNIGALIVLDDHEHLVGMLSERDIVRACLYNSKELDTLLVRKLMSKPVISAAPDEDIGNIMRLMTDNRIRHIPILVEGKLAGVVSIGDVVKSVIEESHNQIQYLKDYLYGDQK